MPIQDWNLKSTFDGSYAIRASRYLNQHPNNDFPEIITHYHNFKLGKWMRDSMQKLVTNLNVPTGSRIIVVGSGWGWGVEWLNENGYVAIAVDTSAYLQNNYLGSEETEINEQLSLADGALDVNTPCWDLDDGQQKLVGDIMVRPDGRRGHTELIDETLSNNGSRRSVRGALSNNVDYIITEAMLSTLSDAELITVADNIDSLRVLDNAICIHSDVWLNPRHASSHDPGYNWKTGAEWREFFDNTLNLPNHVLYDRPNGVTV